MYRIYSFGWQAHLFLLVSIFCARMLFTVVACAVVAAAVDVAAAIVKKQNQTKWPTSNNSAKQNKKQNYTNPISISEYKRCKKK